MKKLWQYILDSKVELTKVTWPTRQQTIRLTTIVVIFSLVLAAFIGTMDFLFSLGLQKLLSGIK